MILPVQGYENYSNDAGELSPCFPDPEVTFIIICRSRN